MIGKILKRNKDNVSDTSVQFIFISLNLVCLIFFILLNSVSKISKKKQQAVVESVKSSFNKRNYQDKSYYLDKKNIIDQDKKNFVQNFKAFYGEEYDLIIDNNFISFEINKDESSIDKLISFFVQSENLNIKSYRIILPYNDKSAQDMAQIHRKISRIGFDKKSELGINTVYQNIYIEIEF
jgi:hypothetical protein